ncbi:5'/3'-nucleotidase SurE [Acetohalobium arabaticum]|uniref:5'-nucleotidase SurE n=1 Tax=Acetohalobium arabaticum (strain ATCC 49924 / DSM 5501 / Z-7288) TaxID=574087 RepID=D9QRC2_ACEAZ|nr:5'/3'-nucleotidase SurE [Acetohalobium arabaticum]ADL13063.1 5'-nucleotidase; exopolyphosphatase; 3'-nucleotidase [Acetohalobium arabaticum DSM 5501]
MKILVTNDDGIYADGIQQLARALAKNPDNEVLVVAPDREQSATGHAITLHRPLRVKEVNYDSADAESLAVNGTPADCVKLGIEAILEEKPDIVISGINRGPNLGCDVLYSGTVSAAFEGILLGVPAVAVSLAAYDDLNFTYAAEFISELVEDLAEKGLDKEVLLNVNIPPCNREELEGVQITKLGNRSYINTFDQRTDPRGEDYYWMGGDIVEEGNDEETDVAAVNQQRISITPIRLNLTDFEAIEELSQKDLDIF